MPAINVDALLKEFVYDPSNPLLFNNGFFVFFFVAFISLYYAFRNNIKTRRYIFCLFSLYFFYKASGLFVGLVIVSSIVDFILSNAIYRQNSKLKKKILLVISIIFNLGLLFYFKYTNFFIAVSNEMFSAGFNPLNILLPVGISFYTFENLSYTIDVYRGELKPATKFTDYLLFLSFFPKLVMGPIVRAHDFLPQINKPYVITEQDFAKGFYLIVSGLFKKLVISDYLTLNYVNYIFDDPGRFTGIENLFAVYAYAAVIYCDFSGYSDIALGIARWLGFKIPANFLSPYQSKNITEFWRRWHISLSSWLKDYLYIPLGGNRKGSVSTVIFSILFFIGVYSFLHFFFEFSILISGSITAGILLLFLLPAILKKNTQQIPTGFNLLTTMLLGGFWHGASWNFLIWGALHGIALAIHKVWILITGEAWKSFNNKSWYKALAIIVTFHFACFCWIFFKSESLNASFVMIKQIVYNWNLDVLPAFYNNYRAVLGMLGLAAILHAIPDHLEDKIINRFQKIPLIVYIVIFFAFLIIYGYFKSAEQVLPIYLQF